MSKSKSKKNQNVAIKITPKIESDLEQVQELQLKKKFLEEKYRKIKINLVAVKSSCENTKQRLAEAKARLNDIKNIKDKENNKFDSINSDFKNQKCLVEINYTDKILTLENLKTERMTQIVNYNNKILEMKAEHEAKMQVKSDTMVTVKNNMDELSKFFSDQLSEIQKNLQDQIDKISTKWETNITEHLKRYEDHVKKYDINNDMK